MVGSPSTRRLNLIPNLGHLTAPPASSPAAGVPRRIPPESCGSGSAAPLPASAAPSTPRPRNIRPWGCVTPPAHTPRHRTACDSLPACNARRGRTTVSGRRMRSPARTPSVLHRHPALCRAASHPTASAVECTYDEEGVRSRSRQGSVDRVPQAHQPQGSIPPAGQSALEQWTTSCAPPERQSPSAAHWRSLCG